MPFFILFNKEALEKMIISSCSNIFILYTKIPCMLIFSLWQEIVFQNFKIFPFLEKAIFSLFSSRKDAHFFVFVTQKRYGNVTFLDYGNVRKSPKITSFRIFSRIYTMRKNVILCSVRRKGVHPYEYMDGWKKFEETSLPPKDAFYSRLNMISISDQDYEHASKFGIE